MAPKRKSSIALRGSQARAGRIAARVKQEQALLARPAVKAFLANMRSEAATFASRCVTGEKLPRLLDGSVFTWDDGFLTDAKNVATKIVNDPDYDVQGIKQDIKTLCEEFLARLDGSEADVVIDPVGAASAELAIAAFTPENWTQWYLLILDLVEYFATKHADGSYYFSRSDMNCEKWLGKVFNQSAEVLELSNLPVR
jgi:hypothetical protein